MPSKNWYRIMLDKLLTFLFPYPCVVCNLPTRKDQYVCNRCQRDIHYIGRNSVCSVCYSAVPDGTTLCGGCLLKPPHYDRLVSGVYFNGSIRKSLHRYKFRGRSDLHGSFSKLMCDQLIKQDCTIFDALVPIPLSKERFKERGYNQAGLLAEDIAAHFGVPYIPDALIRKRNTLRQSELAHQYREGNVRGAFALGNAGVLSKKHVLLVDDIFTTGATVREASKILAKSGCRITVSTVAVARSASEDSFFR